MIFLTQTIPDSQPDLNLSLLEDENSNIKSVGAHKKMTRRVAKSSKSSCDSSDIDSDNDSGSNRSSSNSTISHSSSITNFLSDDSVKDPIYQPSNQKSSGSEEEEQPKLATEQFYISPQPGPSRVEPPSFIDNNLPVVFDTQSPNINNLTSVNTQSPSIDSQSSSVDAQPLSRKKKFIRNHGKKT